MSKFPGFSKDALAFYKAVAFHQNRDWFQENKGLYEREVREPMLALLDQLGERFERARIPLKGSKKSMFRINRDVRFSKDKRPYQTHAGVVLTRTGEKNDPGMLYIHIAPEGSEAWRDAPRGSFAAAGFHLPEPSALNAIRTEIKKSPEAFTEMETALKKARLTLGTDSQLTRVPRGFEDMKGSDFEGAVRLKSYMVETSLSEAVVTSAKLVDSLFNLGERSRPLLEFGWKAIDR